MEEATAVSAPVADAGPVDSGPDATPTPDRIEAEKDRGIPHHRVEEMRRKDREEWDRERSDYERRIRELEGRTRPTTNGNGASHPQVDFRSLLATRASDGRQEHAKIQAMQRQIAISQKASEFSRAWDRISYENREALSIPGVQVALYSVAMDAWRTGGDVYKAVSEAARHYARFTVRPAVPQRKSTVVSAGGGSGAPAAQDPGRGQPVSKRILGALRSRGGEF